MDAFQTVSASELAAARASGDPPVVIDVRREAAYRAGNALVAGALRRNPDHVATWSSELPPGTRVVVYCAEGQVSQGVARALASRGLAAAYLQGGIAAWKASGGALMLKPAGSSTRWITRERPKIDRIACPWLIARFIDHDAEFVYVPAAKVLAEADARTAIPYDVPAVDYSHVGEQCSFDAFVHRHALSDPALAQLATIVRGADTGRPDLAPQSAGLLAVSQGLSQMHSDDHEMLARGMILYDALYAWCRNAQNVQHRWTPETFR